MINEIAEICANCEYSIVGASGEYCVCNRKKNTLVKCNGKCKHFSVDLLKYEMPLPRELTLDDVEL